MDRSPDATDIQRKGGIISTFGLGNCRLLETNVRSSCYNLTPDNFQDRPESKGKKKCHQNRDTEDILSIETPFSFLSMSFFCDYRGYQTLTEKANINRLSP